MGLLRHALITLGFLTAIYLVMLGVSLLMFPADGHIPVGQRVAEETIYASDPRVMVYGRGALANADRKVVFVGASDVMESFRPDQTSRALGGMQIHNMALGGSNMTTTDEVVNLILDATPPEGRKHLTIVLGLWYGLFTTDKQRFEGYPTHIEVEEMRYGLYQPPPDGKGPPQPVLPSRLMLAADFLMRPVLLGSFFRSNYWDPFYYGTKEEILTWLGHGKPPQRFMMAPIEDLDHHQLTDEEKRILNGRENDKVGPASAQTDEGFHHLIRMARRTQEAGVRLIILDMPITSWHAAAMPQFASFQTRKRPWLAAVLRYPNVRYVNLQKDVDDSEFSDFIHPRPRFTNEWAKRAAKLIRADAQ